MSPTSSFAICLRFVFLQHMLALLPNMYCGDETTAVSDLLNSTHLLRRKMFTIRFLEHHQKGAFAMHAQSIKR